jgi:hypothetical protein
MKQNSHVVRAKTCIKFDSKGADWCTYQNFKEMYREVYKEMVEGGEASKLIEPTQFDKTGNIVDAEEEVFGLKSDYILLYPEKLLFADEVGNNTSQANDGNVGDEKFLCFVDC